MHLCLHRDTLFRAACIGSGIAVRQVLGKSGAYRTACLICGFVTGWIFGLLAMIPAVGVVFAVLKKVVGIALWLTAAFYIIYAAAHAARCRAKDVPFFGYIRFIR